MTFIRSLLVVCLCTLAGLARAETRVALVIGNADYEHADKLANPLLDARGVRDALGKLGFSPSSIVYGENLSKREMERKIAAFATIAKDADVAVAYFAGHGATFGGVPYVVPTDAKFDALEAMPYELVPLETMVAELRLAKGVRVAIVDACRDNEAEKALKRRTGTRGAPVSSGLSPLRTPDGLIVAFSTQYNTTAADGPAGQNSPFTAALLQKMPTPGLDIKDMFFQTGAQVIRETKGSQRPEIAVSIYEPFSLAPVVAPVVKEELPQLAAVVDPTVLRLIAGLTDRGQLDELSRNSSSLVQAAAKARLASLGPCEPTGSTRFIPPSKISRLGIDLNNRKPVATKRGFVEPIYYEATGFSSLSFSPSGRQIVSGGTDGTVQLWDIDTGVLLRTLQSRSYFSLSEGVLSVAFSADGRRIASGHKEAAVRIWDVDSGQLIRELRRHTEFVRSVVFSPNGHWIASGSRDKTINLWTAENSVHVSELVGHSAGVMTLSFSPGSSRLASGGCDNTIKIWDVNSATQLRSLHGHKNCVTALAFSSDGCRIASGSDDHTIKLWDAENGILLRTFPGHSDNINAVSFQENDSVIVSGSRDGEIKSWNVKDGVNLLTAGQRSRSFTPTTFSQDGHWVAQGRAGLNIFTVDSNEYKLTIFSFPDNQYATFFPDNTYLASPKAVDKYLSIKELPDASNVSRPSR